jgi:hypothetical protein
MINKRKLDELIQVAICDTERDCGYTFEEYCMDTFYQEHVCGYVNECIMPYFLAEYIYEECYYEDFETVKANVNYVNTVMPQSKSFKTWVEMPLEFILKEIKNKKQAEKKKIEEMLESPSVWDSL